MNSNFTIDDFKESFRTLGADFKLQDVEMFIESVVADYEFFQAMSKDEFSEREKSNAIPNRYKGHELEYFIMSHFVRHFFQGTEITKGINNAFADTKVRAFNFIDSSILFQPLKITQNLNDEISAIQVDLMERINVIGESLFGKDFNIYDFIKLQ